MTVKITKTSAQAQMERNTLNMENNCPECGQFAIGVTSTMIGLFKTTEKTSYSCWKCGCHWETD